MTQNTSHAVMAQRYEAKDSLDDFPTPPWAVKALFAHDLIKPGHYENKVCWEPACNRGFMARALKRHFARVICTDVFNYGYGDTADYLTSQPNELCDWVITNPPFRLAEAFVEKALHDARIGVAILVRTSFLEGNKRFKNLFAPYPPMIVAQFVERVPMVKSRVDPKASTATSYCWIIWNKRGIGGTELRWIPPCRKVLECESDYILPVLE